MARHDPDPDEVPASVTQADSGEARADAAPPVAGPAAAAPLGAGPRYRVVGPRTVLGVAPGGLVVPNVTPGELRVLLGSGHLAPENASESASENSQSESEKGKE